MIILNGKKFAENETEFKNSLFISGGTCAGYVKFHKKSISILDHNKNKIGVIVNSVLGKATKREEGYWYSYGTPELIGNYSSYLQECKDIDIAMERIKL